MALILPLVKKYDAAIIALPNDADEIPMEADKRLELVAARSSTSPPRSTASPRRTSSSTRWPCRSAPTPTVVADHAGDDARGSATSTALNMTCGASNVSFGMPGPAHPRRGLPADGDDRRADQRDHGHPHAADRRGRQGGRPAARPRRVGRAWIAAHRSASRPPPRAMSRDPGATTEPPRLRRRRPPPRGADRPPDGAGAAPRTTAPAGSQLSLHARPAARSGCRPASACSTRRAGTASRSTRPAAATAPARSARSRSPTAPSRSPARRAHLHRRRSSRDGWRLACLAQATARPRASTCRR